MSRSIRLTFVWEEKNDIEKKNKNRRKTETSTLHSQFRRQNCRHKFFLQNRQRQVTEFEVSLVYTAGSRPARATWRLSQKMGKKVKVSHKVYLNKTSVNCFEKVFIKVLEKE